MALSGTLKTMALSDLFQWLKASRKSGVLTIANHGEERILYFKDGSITDFSSREMRQNLPQLLVGFGLVSEVDITKAFRLQRTRKNESLAETLLSEKMVDAEAVKSFLGETARDQVLDLFLEREGTFVFSDYDDTFEMDETPFERVPLELDMEEAILEGMRRMDEWAGVRTKLSSDTLRLDMLKPEALAELPAGSRELRALKAAAQGLSIGEVCLELRSSRYSVYRILYTALQNGIVKISADSAAENQRDEADDRVARLLSQAVTMLDSRQWDESIAIFELIVRINPDDVEAQRGRKRALEEQVAELYQALPPVAVLKLKIPRERLRDFNLSSEESFIATRINGDFDVGTLVMVSPMSELATMKLLKRLLHIEVAELA